RVLDDLLFDAVLAARVHELVAVPDLGALAGSLVELANSVVTCGYLVVRLEGPSGPRYAVCAREVWPEPTDAAALAALGIDAGAEVEVLAAGPTAAGATVI